MADLGHWLEDRLGGSMTFEEAQETVDMFIHDDTDIRKNNLLVTHEVLALAARKPAYRDITSELMRLHSHALERHFKSETARGIAALLHGLSFLRAFDQSRYNTASSKELVGRMPVKDGQSPVDKSKGDWIVINHDDSFRDRAPRCGWWRGSRSAKPC